MTQIMKLELSLHEFDFTLQFNVQSGESEMPEYRVKIHLQEKVFIVKILEKITVTLL